MAKRKPVGLGDKVKDPVTGHTGIAIAITTYMNGCDRIAVQGKIDKGGKIPEFHFDEPQLKIVKRKEIKVEPDEVRKVTGGPAFAYSPPKS